MPLRPLALAAWLGAQLGSAGAAPLLLSTTPPVVAGKGPVPNVVLTVDDSGSMDSIMGGGDSRSRIEALKASLVRQFGSGASAGRTADGSIRLAWQSLNAVSGIQPGATNAMRSFEGAHRLNFSAFVNSLAATGSTPMNRAAANAVEYMKTPPGLHSPWADAPGSPQQGPYLACRKAFHILLSDGGPNDSLTSTIRSNQALRLPDGTQYDPTSNQVKVYVDASPKVADHAFAGWAQDLQPTLPDKVPPSMRKTGVEQVGTVAVQPYWNARNNPATWQHLQTFTIGFGDDMGSVGGHPSWDAATGDNFGGDYAALVQGTMLWPTNEISALWHASLNGRGRFYPAVSSAALDKAFDEIFAEIQASSAPVLSAVTVSSRSLSFGLLSYQSTYNTTGWSGDVAAFAVNPDTGVVSTSTAWSAAALMDSPSFNVAGRFVLGYDGSRGFAWNSLAALPAAQRDSLNQNANGSADGNGAARLAFLRGENNAALVASGELRARSSRLGDIVNSQLWYVGAPNAPHALGNYAAFRSANRGRSPMVYVGANDGMLHGFVASGPNAGTELLAYVPQGIAQGAMRTLTDPNYTHRFFVDGSPFSGDAYLGGSMGWRTVLVGSLGLGGRGYFGLDVSDTRRFNEANAGALVLFDTTASNDPDIGHITAPPTQDPVVDGQSAQIVRLNNGRWAALLGNGVNSANEAPVLLVQYLDQARELRKISPCPSAAGCQFAGTNGLGAPAVIDLDGNGTADVVYAGDLRGHVWRFDLDDSNDARWHVAFGNQPLFVAQPRNGVRQPITAAPAWLTHPNGGIMLVVGTGSLLTEADRTSTEQQTIYGLYDKSAFSFAGAQVQINDATPINRSTDVGVPATLVQQRAGGSTVVNGKTYLSGSSTPVNYGGAQPARGWYLNVPMPRQRVVAHPTHWFDNLVAVPALAPGSSTATQAPAGGACSYSAQPDEAYTYVLNAISGAPSRQPLLAGSTDTTLVGFRDRGGSEITLQSRAGVVRSASDGSSGTDTYRRPPTLGVRMNWREKR